MSWLNVLYEIRDNIKSAQTESQVNVKYTSARTASSGSPAENPFQTTNLFTKAGPIANIARFLSQHLVLSEDILIAIKVIRSMRISTVWLRETNFEVIKKGLLI